MRPGKFVRRPPRGSMLKSEKKESPPIFTSLGERRGESVPCRREVEDIGTKIEMTELVIVD